MILSIDGIHVTNFEEVITDIFLGHDLAPDGRRRCTIVAERDGRKIEFTVYPRLSGDDKVRSTGIEPAEDLTVDGTVDGSPAQAAGVLAGDNIVAVDGQPVYQRGSLSAYLAQNATHPVEFLLRREGPRNKSPDSAAHGTDERTHRPIARVGIRYRDNVIIVHPTPWQQLSEDATGMFRTLGALLNPSSDIGPSKLSGPVGMARELYRQAQWDFRPRPLSLTVLINVSFAILNLLPIPVLDGGQMLFATIGRVRGRALPISFGRRHPEHLHGPDPVADALRHDLRRHPPDRARLPGRIGGAGTGEEGGAHEAVGTDGPLLIVYRLLSGVDRPLLIAFRLTLHGCWFDSGIAIDQ